MKHVEACYMPEMIDKAVFTALEALCEWWEPVYVRERPDNAVLTSECVYCEACAGLFK